MRGIYFLFLYAHGLNFYLEHFEFRKKGVTMHSLEEKIFELKNVLMKVWSIESSSKWTPQNPAKG
jgi:hypothetical protein